MGSGLIRHANSHNYSAEQYSTDEASSAKERNFIAKHCNKALLHLKRSKQSDEILTAMFVLSGKDTRQQARGCVPVHLSTVYGSINVET